MAPITHVPHKDIDASLEIPREVCRALGLDNDRQWLRFDELNSFLWPGYDLRKRPGSLDKYDYGLLPKDLFEQLKYGILLRQQKLKAHIISRDD
ncbi:hypothetical protein [Phyllobacterium zundukense]|uniref:Uncharacterized protein n=1 Tax=Phyllobacterium zundukense TaxID=1867719 RepID=A0ACD4D1U1_9HYPH|nr:hypothetical protein [Phyllobacterium zundukense]UXN59643.1 hypothetical protein N8E88_24140 [Phyllobacterium zundukense]